MALWWFNRMPRLDRTIMENWRRPLRGKRTNSNAVGRLTGIQRGSQAGRFYLRSTLRAAPGDHFEPGPAAEPRDALCANFLDDGVCGFLEGAENPDREWSPLAKSFIGKYKTPTLRNVDKRPRPDFVKAYMHNGYLKSLKEAVHFYNTRDALPHCKAGDPGEKVTCWPAPEHPETMNRRQLGNLGLTTRQEDQIVAFLKTLTDGYVAAGK